VPDTPQTCPRCHEALRFAEDMLVRCECTSDAGRFEEGMPGYHCPRCDKYFTADTVDETSGYSHWWS